MGRPGHLLDPGLGVFTDDGAAGARVLLSQVRRVGVRERLILGPAASLGDHIRAGWITHATRYPSRALRPFAAAPDLRSELV
jgi:hypothetical protein